MTRKVQQGLWPDEPVAQDNPEPRGITPDVPKDPGVSEPDDVHNPFSGHVAAGPQKADRVPGDAFASWLDTGGRATEAEFANSEPEGVEVDDTE